ncbi:MAG: CDGSH iron-sulfur domain-containing protein [Tepidisphaera sp.]|jgi:CDGSH-type Zn-finger protein
MARLVKLDQAGPVKIEPGHERPVWVCACGLSKTFPICDGSHKTTAKVEEPGKLYQYDPVTLAVLKVEDLPPAKPQG